MFYSGRSDTKAAAQFDVSERMVRRGIAILQHGTPAQIASAEKGKLSMTNIADEVTAMIFPEPEKSGRGKKGRSGKGRGFRGVYRAAGI